MRKLKRWTKEETEYLFNFWDGEWSAESIAKHLNLTPSQVAAKAKYHKIGGKGGRGPKSKLWSKEELECLSELAECYLFEELVKKYNYKAKLMKWRSRTKSAIQQKLFDLGCTAVPQVGYLTEGLVCSLLNRTYEWIRNAIKQGKLRVKRQGRGNFVSEKDFLQFCVIYRSEISERIGREGIEYILSLLIKD